MTNAFLNSKNKTLIIGKGEIGNALFKILDSHYDTYIRDRENLDIRGIEVLHICFPYSDKFVEMVQYYQSQYNPKFTVIHSTVPIGTTTKLYAYHSPVRGVHPNLKEGIKTFVKYLAPNSEELKQYFNRAGIKIVMVDKPENTEAQKLWETTQYAWFIVLEKEIYKWCQENNLDFNIIYTEANKTYNEGYFKLGMKNVIRPILKQANGKIGGHCIIPNCELLESEVAKIILKMNQQY